MPSTIKFLHKKTKTAVSQTLPHYSITTKCSPQAREFIIDKFGGANSIEELLIDIDAFICTRTYIPKKDSDIVQTFDIDDFIANDCFPKTFLNRVAIVEYWMTLR